MPLTNLHLLTLHPSTPLPPILLTLQHLPTPHLLTALPHRWIIAPPPSSPLSQNYDILLIHPSPSLPPSLTAHISHHFHLTIGIPSSLLSSFPTRNQELLHPSPSEVPALTGSLEAPKIASSAKDLELDEGLREWIEGTEAPRGAVTMLNFLSFREGKRGEYMKYGAEFAERVGKRRGGVAKLVGKVVEQEGGNKEGWEEIALAHYPTLTHFADMLASQDYQDVNQKYRVPSLKETCILCTSEIGVEKILSEQEVRGGRGGGVKL